jgi:hypothetical protein
MDNPPKVRASWSVHIRDAIHKSFAPPRSNLPVRRTVRQRPLLANRPAGVEVNRTLKIAAVDVAAGGKTPVHLSAMASLRRHTARFAHASNALHPTLV